MKQLTTICLTPYYYYYYFFFRERKSNIVVVVVVVGNILSGTTWVYVVRNVFRKYPENILYDLLRSK